MTNAPRGGVRSTRANLGEGSLGRRIDSSTVVRRFWAAFFFLVRWSLGLLLLILWTAESLPW